jgi:hypothetical protein
VSAPLEPVLSAFQLRYSTLLSAMEGSEDRLSTLIRSSLRQYQMKARARRAAIELEDLGGSLDGEVDDQDGLIDFLALQSRLSSADKEQRRARNARTKSRGSEAASRRLDRARRQQKQLSELLHVHPSHEVARELEGSDPE